MGGTVAEIIRRENGEVIKMARKTGAYNWMFFTKEFCEGEFDIAINKHIKSFFKMREDYLKGKPYKYNMTPVYGWYEDIYPISYGLVVIDFQKKKIHSMQGYDRPGYYYASSLSNRIHLDNDTKFNFDYLLKNNLLLIVNHDDIADNKNINDIKKVFGEDFSLDKLRIKIDSVFNKIKVFLDYKNSIYNLFFFPKVLSDFEIIKYEETPNGSLLFLKALLNDGFSFNKSDFDGWKEKINNFDDSDFLNDEDYKCA